MNTYWLAEPVKTAFSLSAWLTVEGGDHTLRYKIYLEPNGHPGIMKNGFKY